MTVKQSTKFVKFVPHLSIFKQEKITVRLGFLRIVIPNSLFIIVQLSTTYRKLTKLIYFLNEISRNIFNTILL